MLKIYANGESGDIIWNGHFPDIIDELAVANVTIIRIMADEIKKNDKEIIQALAKCLLTELKDELRKEIEEIEFNARFDRRI